MKKKLSVLFIIAVMCFAVMTGCGSANDENNNSTQGIQQPSTEMNNGAGQNNSTTGATQNNTTNTNGTNGTNGTGTNGTNTNGTNTNGQSEGVIEEIATDIGNGIEDIGNDITDTNNNNNVNDVTRGMR